MRSFGLTAGLVVLIVANSAHGQQETIELDVEAEAQTDALAEAAVETDDDRARQQCDIARSAYDSGRFQAALEGFEESYRLSRRPELLFNIAQANDRLAQPELALEGYQAYLAEVPDAENRAYVNSRIGVIQGQLSGAPAEPSESIAGPVVLFGVAGASGIVGIVSGILALGISSDLADQCNNNRCSTELIDEQDSMRSLALVADITLGISLGAALAATAWLLFAGADAASPPAEASCGPDGCIVRSSFRF